MMWTKARFWSYGLEVMIKTKDIQGIFCFSKNVFKFVVHKYCFSEHHVKGDIWIVI